MIEEGKVRHLSVGPPFHPQVVQFYKQASFLFARRVRKAMEMEASSQRGSPPSPQTRGVPDRHSFWSFEIGGRFPEAASFQAGAPDCHPCRFLPF